MPLRNKKLIKKLCASLEYEFKNLSLLEEALIHPSFATIQKNNNQSVKHYERLEFLGDSVLSLIVAEMLFFMYPQENEGKIAKRHSALVCRGAIVEVAKKIDLANLIKMSNGEETTGGRNNESNMENAMEALIGALYLDGGIDVTKNFVLRYWSDMAKTEAQPLKDPKSELQEWLQSRSKTLPQYNLVKTEGNDHSPVFTVEVNIDGVGKASASGTTKKEAQKKVAIEILKIIKDKN